MQLHALYGYRLRAPLRAFDINFPNTGCAVEANTDHLPISSREISLCEVMGGGDSAANDLLASGNVKRY